MVAGRASCDKRIVRTAAEHRINTRRHRADGMHRRLERLRAGDRILVNPSHPRLGHHGRHERHMLFRMGEHNMLFIPARRVKANQCIELVA